MDAPPHAARAALAERKWNRKHLLIYDLASPSGFALEQPGKQHSLSSALPTPLTALQFLYIKRLVGLSEALRDI